MKNITRRDFVKGMAAAGAGVGLVTILPGGVITSSEALWSGNSVGSVWGNWIDSILKPKRKDGLYIKGSWENLNGKKYTLEFVQPIQLEVVIGGKVQEEGTWRSSAKQLVAVDPTGNVVMHDGVGGYDVVVSWSKDGKTFSVTLHTSPTAGAHAIDVDRPMTRGEFMVRLNRYFNWYHYNVVMDDGVDIDDDGEYAESPRVRNYYDVTGVADYVKPIESALDLGILHAESSDECFYPMAEMTRQDAAVIFCSAFHMEPLDEDYISKFSDAAKIDPDCYDALNTLVGRNFMRGRTNDTLNPTDAITATEARIIIEDIDGRVSSPVWGTPVSNRKFVRIRPELFTHDDQATVHYRYRCFNLSHPELEGVASQDMNKAYGGLQNDGPWTEWKDYIPDYTIDAFFGMQSANFLPYDKVSFCVEFEAYSTREGKEDSGVTHFVWRIERPAWHDFAIDKLHEGGENFPTVYRFFDNFQAAAYYIEGSEYGVLYDGLMPTNTSTTLYDRVKNEFATKPFCFVLGHGHPDHNGAMPPCAAAGLPIYRCDRLVTPGGNWSYTIRPTDYISGNDGEKITGTYENETLIDEGYVFDLGNCKLETLRLPGHCDDMLMLYDRENGLLFSSDIYGVNRYWVADQFSATGVKQDLLLSLHQQLMDIYAKDGGAVKELYTGHNRTGVGADYLTIWERSLQKLVDFGPDAVTDDRRSDGAILSRDGDPYDDTNMNWCGFVESGKQHVVEYVGKVDQKKFRRIETNTIGVDPDTGKKVALVDSNMYYNWKTVARLSNISFRDAELVGHDFLYKLGMSDTYDQTLEDGRVKYALTNKFFPEDLDYEVKIAKGQKTVTFTPVAMSNRIQSLTVNGVKHSSRCPITVKTSATTKITVVGPDGTETLTYTLTFVQA